MFKGSDPKPRARMRLSPKSYRLLLERMLAKYPRCECGCGRPSESAHHVVSRGQGGDDIEENLLMLAGDGVRLCHGAVEGNRPFDHDRGVQLTPERTRAACRLRIETVRLDVKAYVLGRKGIAWFEGRYQEETRK